MSDRNKLSNAARSPLSPLVLIIFLVINCCVFPGKTSVEAIEKTVNYGMTSDFQSALDSLQSKYGFPGATAAFVLRDGTVGSVATGMADIESGRPMTKESRMLSASLGKSFVGATVIALSYEGKLDLDAPVSCWLGDRNWFSRLPNHDRITLRHLLTHSSGLPDHVHMDKFASAVSHKWRGENNPFSPEELIEFVLDLPPLFDSGKGWRYTDTGYILLGLIIEEATGSSIYDKISSRFLTPLGLKLTSPSNTLFLPGLAPGYLAEDNPFGFPQKTSTADGLMVWHPGLEWAGGGLVSNSRDLALWGWLLFRGNAMPCPYLDELLHSVPVSEDTEGIRYGAGVAIYRTGPFGPVYGHGGWIPGYCSSLRYYSEHGISIAFQINTDIGMMNDSTPVIQEMESCLAEIIISAASHQEFQISSSDFR